MMSTPSVLARNPLFTWPRRVVSSNGVWAAPVCEQGAHLDVLALPRDRVLLPVGPGDTPVQRPTRGGQFDCGCLSARAMHPQGGTAARARTQANGTLERKLPTLDFCFATRLWHWPDVEAEDARAGRVRPEDLVGGRVPEQDVTRRVGGQHEVLRGGRVEELEAGARRGFFKRE